MATIRVFQAADGTLRMLYPQEDSLDDATARAIEADTSLADLTFVDVASESLPDRADRQKWRIHDGRVVVVE